MITTEVINGNLVKIDWSFEEKIDLLKSNWWSWRVEGIGDDGKHYEGSQEADGDDPNLLFDYEVSEIEELVLK